MNHDVYICFDEKDQITADAICHALESNKIKCWLKTRDLGVSHMVDAIMEAIYQASVMVLIFSSHSKDSNFVNTEVDLAFTKNIPILVFKIDESKLDGGLEFFLSNKHWLDAYPDPEVKFENLIIDTSKILGRPISEPVVNDESQHNDELHHVEEISESEQVVAPVEDVSEVESESETVSPVKNEKTKSKNDVKPKKENKNVDGGSGVFSNSKLPILIAIAVIAVVAIVGCYFVFNGSADYETSTVILSDSAYMEVPKNPNATSKADKKGIFYYIDDKKGLNVTSSNANITKKSGISSMNKLVSDIESSSKKTEEKGAVIYENNGVYSVVVNDTKYGNIIVIQSTNKDLLLKSWESVKVHDPLDSFKIKDNSSVVVNATHETAVAVQQADSTSSSSSSQPSSPSSTHTSTEGGYDDWGSQESDSGTGGYDDWGSQESDSGTGGYDDWGK